MPTSFIAAESFLSKKLNGYPPPVIAYLFFCQSPVLFRASGLSSTLEIEFVSTLANAPLDL